MGGLFIASFLRLKQCLLSHFKT